MFGPDRSNCHLLFHHMPIQLLTESIKNIILKYFFMSKIHLQMQQTPKPLAQLPPLVPPRLLHSSLQEATHQI